MKLGKFFVTVSGSLVSFFDEAWPNSLSLFEGHWFLSLMKLGQFFVTVSGSLVSFFDEAWPILCHCLKVIGFFH